MIHPADIIVGKFGSKGGTNGLIPQKHHRALIEYARANGIELSSADFAEPDSLAGAA